MTQPEPLATAKEIAQYLNTTEEALAQMRYHRRGPKYIRLGKGGSIRYKWSDIEEFLKANTVENQ